MDSMIKGLVGFLLILSLSLPASAAALSAPEVPVSGVDSMPKETDSFGDGLLEIIHNGISFIQPELTEAVHANAGILLSVFLFSTFSLLSDKITASVSIAGTLTVASLIFQNTKSLIGCASKALTDICVYGKLLCPVLTTALAAQGGVSASAALYAGTTAFISVLSVLVSGWIVPMVYIFLTFSVARCAVGEDILKRFAEAIKNVLNWLIKTLLIVFTTYMSITGVVSGTTDAAALKAAKVTISSVVPVVGGILSDASESVLVSMGIVKNAAGIYGILAVLAVFIGPFVKIGVQYLLLKITAGICTLFANKNISALVEDFSAALGFLLAMVATGCVMVLISTVCFMKGFG